MMILDADTSILASTLQPLDRVIVFRCLLRSSVNRTAMAFAGCPGPQSPPTGGLNFFQDCEGEGLRM